jgi:PadR family transcriptional regulator, regulatory protein PadR
VPENGSRAQLVRGVIEYCVLSLLEPEARYGFELAQRLGKSGSLLTTEGTVYPLLTRLRNDGLVTTEWRESNAGPPRRYYKLTTAGRHALSDFRQEWVQFRQAVEAVLLGGNE